MELTMKEWQERERERERESSEWSKEKNA